MNVRKIRIEQSIQNEISQMLLKDLRDPRIGFCTISHVRLSQDFRYASVYVSFIGGKDAVEKGMKGLQSASKTIQSLLAQKLNLKFTPYIRFIYDDAVEKGIALIEKIREVAPPEDNESDEDPTTSL
jgi:ribosome-binding factor A